MQYELLTHRGMQPDDSMTMKSLLYTYSRYRKDREENAQKQNAGKSQQPSMRR